MEAGLVRSRVMVRYIIYPRHPGVWPKTPSHEGGESPDTYQNPSLIAITKGTYIHNTTVLGSLAHPPA